MKQFFAKAIIVDESREKCHCGEGYNNPECTKLQEERNDFMQCVHCQPKLFICSKDIKFGDEFIVASSNTKVIFTDSYREIQPDDYKIIGRVSPEAVWVKEGDTFSEDEIHMCAMNTVHPHTCVRLKENWHIHYPHLFVLCCKILNHSCKHFH